MRRLFADKRTLRLRAIRWAMALPVAYWFFADGLTSRLRVGAFCVAQWIFADSITLRALANFTVLHRASDFAFGLITFNFTL